MQHCNVGRFLLALVPGLLGAQAPPRADVPVRSVMLFSSGVGYFEHTGTVRGNSATELRFKTSQINDILKSLMLQDLDGGKVATISYPSQDPIGKTLKSFQVDITGNPGMAALLNQLRGARITVQIQGEKVSGTILGVETRQQPGGGAAPIIVPVLNLLAGATIRSLDLQSTTSLVFDEPQLQEELTRALGALAQARDQDKKPVTIHFSGDGTRRVRIGYVVETPIWKTSYRLVLDGKHADLQGWAIVENQTESDWKDVSLTLVSGRPISFIMDLYQPLYLPRPVVTPQLFAGLRPQRYDSGLELDIAPNSFEDVTLTTGAPGAQYGNALGGITNITRNALSDRSASTQTLDRDFVKSVRSVAETGRLGELFQYQVRDVTLARHASAMLPIVTDSVAVERLSIYNAAVQPRYPLTGLRLKNITGKHLLQGPVTVLDQGGYGGDAQIDNVPPGQERLLSYGVDLDLQVDNTADTRTAAVVTGKVAKGVLTIQQKQVSSREYRTENRGTRDKTLILEHPVRQGWMLVDSPKPVETTASVYRFQGNAAAGKVTVLTVKEEVVVRESMTLLGADSALLLRYSRTGEIPKSVRDAIMRTLQLKEGVRAIERQIAEKTTRIGEIASEQTRIRENLRTVAANTPYSERLLAKLNEQESIIETLQGERDALQQRRDTQQQALAAFLADLTVE